MEYLLAKWASKIRPSFKTDRFLEEIKNWGQIYRMNENWSRYLPLILVQPRVNTFPDLFSLKRNDVASLLSRHANLLSLRFGLESMTAHSRSLHLLEHDCILASHFWQKPSTGQVVLWVSDVHFKLDLLIDMHCDNLGAYCPNNGLKRRAAVTLSGCLTRRLVLRNSCCNVSHLGSDRLIIWTSYPLIRLPNQST